MSKIKVLSFGCLGMLVLLSMVRNLPQAAVEKAPEIQTRNGGEYRTPLASEPLTLDPAYYTDIYSMNVAANLFDGLVEFDENLNVVPAIAKRWKISRDHRTYTFLLKEGVKFHNGREVTAEDFIYSFKRILGPDAKSPVAPLFLYIQGAKAYHEGNNTTVSGLSAPDPYTLIIELEQPFAPFLTILGMVNAKVVPKEAMGPDFSKRPIGTGPFRFRAWEPGKEIILDANPDYFAGAPYLSALRFRIYLNIQWEQIFADFQKGLLEHALIPSEQYKQILSAAADQAPYTVISKPGLNLVYLGMNLKSSPFNDLRIRQAISQAVDTKAIVEQITSRGSIHAKGILPPGIAGHDPVFRGYGYDPKRARELLAEAGYPEGAGFPVVEVWTVSKAESVQRELKEYQRYLAEIGIQAVPKTAKDWKEFVGMISDNKAPLFYAAWYADYPDPDNFFYPLFYSGSSTNRMGLRDPQVDELLNQARLETDYMKRVDIYRDVEKLIMNSAPIIPQHVNSNNYIFQSWVQGVELSNLGEIYLPFRKIWFDRQKLVRH